MALPLDYPTQTSDDEEFEIIENKPFRFSTAQKQREDALISEFVDLGLQESGAKKWHVYEHSEQFKIDYKVNKTDRIYTVRCSTVISNADIHEYVLFCRCDRDHHNFLSSFPGNDDQTKFVHRISDHRSVLHSCIEPKSINSYLVAPRDWCYVQTMFEKKNYCAPVTEILNGHLVQSDEEEFAYIAGSFCYQNNEHPYYVNQVESNFVRGRVLRCGYLLVKLDYASFRVIHMFCSDWSGSVPYWYLNQCVIPFDGQKIQQFHHQWLNKIHQAVAERKQEDKRKHHRKKQADDIE